MRSPEQVLEVLRLNSHKPQYIFTRLYRNLYNSELLSKDGSVPLVKLEELITALRDESYQPKPFEKSHTNEADGIIIAAVTKLLESVYDNELQRTVKHERYALKKMLAIGKSSKWWITGEIPLNLSKEELLDTLRKRIQDEKFLRLISKLIRSGYLNDVHFTPYSKTIVNCPLLEVLLEISLKDFDTYCEANYQYVRHKNQFALGLSGTKAQIAEIETALKEIIPVETKIYHHTDTVRFLGYDLIDNEKLSVPKENVHKFLRENGFWKAEKAIHRGRNFNNSDLEILNTYNKIFNRFYQFYQYAYDVKPKLAYAYLIFQQSFCKTLAGKYRTKVARLLSARDSSGKKKYFREGIWGVTRVNDNGENQFIPLFPKDEIVCKRI